MKEKKEDTVSTQKLSRDGREPPARILVVDDDHMIRELLRQILEPCEYKVDLSESSGDALEKLIDYKYNLLLLDARLPGISGFELLKYCKKHHPLMEIIMITGNPEIDDAISTVKDGAFDYIAKPFSVEKIKSRVGDALTHQKKELVKKLSLSSSSNLMDATAIESPLPGYTVERTLGTGTMGIVLLVKKNKVYYALKMLRKEGDETTDSGRIKRFLREAKILSQIDHPNVVKIYDSGFPENNDVPYILMEYIDGQPLTDYIKDNKLTLEQKLYIISQIASALAIVHKFGVLHRDIKPSNILIMEGYIAKLTDFGIAKIADSSLTMTHEVLGSPAYMPPETFNIKKPIDSRSDIFSLGILSYELITGDKPFHGETVAEMMTAIQNSRPMEPKKIVEKLPDEVQAILAKMLRKNPEERFQSAQELLKALKNLGRENTNVSEKSRGFFRNLLGSGRVWA